MVKSSGKGQGVKCGNTLQFNNSMPNMFSVGCFLYRNIWCNILSVFVSEIQIVKFDITHISNMK